MDDNLLSFAEKVGQDIAALENPRPLGSQVDLDTIFGFDYGRAQSSSITSNPDLHYPPGAIHGYLRSIELSPNYTVHTWVDSWAGFVAIRIHYSGTWRDWKILPGHQEIAEIRGDIADLQSQLGSGASVTVDSGTSVTYGDFAPQPITGLDNATYWHSPAGTTFIPNGYRGEGLVGRFAQATGYSEMAITKHGVHTRVSCINPITQRHVTYTIEGGDSTTSSTRDDFHIIREIYIGAVVDGTPSMDTMIKRRSNMEFAFQMTVGGVTEWSPYHGTVNTYYLGTPNMVNLATGESIDFKNMASSTHLTGVGGIQLTQQVRIEHPTQPGETIATARSVTTITPDGLLQSETVLTAVKDFEIANNYLPMTPMELEASTEFTTGRGESIQLDPSIPADTYYTDLNEGKDFTTGVFTGDGTFAAFAMLNPGATWAENIPSPGSSNPLRVEARSSNGQRKLYASPFEPGSQIRAGSAWRMAGQWRYGEADSPTQYI